VPAGIEGLVRVQVSTPSSGTGESVSFAGSQSATASADDDTTGVGARAAGWRLLYVNLRDRLGPDRADRVAVSDGTVSMTIRSVADDADWRVRVRTVSSESFSIIGIPVRAGDLFRETSDPTDVVVNESLARMLWPGQSALGRTLHASEPLRVVGVVSDAHWIDFAEPGPTLFRRGFGRMLVQNEPVILDAVRASVAEISPGARVFFAPIAPGGVEEYIAVSSLAAALGLIALGMAAAGTFGVLMYLSAQRTREIAVRMALGARAAHVAHLVTSEALGGLVIGAAAGLALSLAAAPVLRAYLLGLGPYDPLAYLAAVAVLAVAGVLSCVAPIRRAVSIDPAITLRHE
jgi:putative ABC transport system permease protein